MRPLFALLTVAAILGGVKAYTLFVDSLPQRTPLQYDRRAEGVFSLEVTTTFPVGPDEFALEEQSESLVVEFQGRELFRSDQPLAAGAPIWIEEIEGIEEGRNEFFVKATPAAAPADEFSLDAGSEEPVARAIRVRVFRDGAPLGEATGWSEPGSIVELTVPVEVPEESEPHEH